MSNSKINRAFNLTLEVLQGCRYNCAGCMVDKDFDPGPFTEDRGSMVDLVDQMRSRGYPLTEFTVGPVDVIASRAGVKILEHPLVRDMADRYENIVLPLALLDDVGLDELADAINELMPGKSLKIATPFPIRSIDNVKHIELIKSRINYVIDRLDGVNFKQLYLTVNMTGDSSERFDARADKKIHDIDFGVNRLVEYVFPQVRKGFDDIMNRQAFLRALGDFCDVIQETRSRYLVKPSDDSIELTYRARKLYYTPTVIEKLPIFSPEFELSDWSADVVESFEEDQYLRELSKRASEGNCSDCMHVNRCAQGDIHAVMTHLNTDDCIIRMKNNWSVPL